MTRRHPLDPHITPSEERRDFWCGILVGVSGSIVIYLMLVFMWLEGTR